MTSLYGALEVRFQCLWPPSRLFHGLTQRRVHRVFPLVDDAAGEFPAELLRNEAVTPHHQNAVLITNDDGDCYMVKPYGVVFEPFHSWRLHVPELKLHPSVGVRVALAVDTPRFQHFRTLNTHRARYPVRTPSPHLQLPLGDETGEHPWSRPADAEFFHEYAF